MKSVVLRGQFFEDSLVMSIHPETEYEFMACSNTLKFLCSASNCESVDAYLEVVPSTQMLVVENAMRLVGNMGFQTFLNCEGSLVNPSGSF